MQTHLDELQRLVDSLRVTPKVEEDTPQHLRVSSFEALVRNYPSGLGVKGNTVLHCADGRVAELFRGNSRVSVMADAAEDAIDVTSLENGRMATDWFGKFDRDFGVRIKETLGSPLVAVDCGSMEWGAANWSALVSQVNANFVVLRGQLSFTYCYDGMLTGRQFFSILNAADFCVGEEGMILDMAALLECQGAALVTERGRYNMVEFPGSDGSIGNVSYDAVLQLVRELCRTGV